MLIFTIFIENCILNIYKKKPILRSTFFSPQVQKMTSPMHQYTIKNFSIRIMF